MPRIFRLMYLYARQKLPETDLLEAGYTSRIETQSFEAFSTGSGITLWTGYIGGSALGERGLPAEKVGKSAAEEIIPELRLQEPLWTYIWQTS